jgi:hypothetical protein
MFCDSLMLGPACGRPLRFVAGVEVTYSDRILAGFNAWQNEAGRYEVYDNQPTVNQTFEP